MLQELRQLTFFELDCFVQVANLGSIREVARANGIQPAQLSRMIKRFEERTGKTLFSRSHRGLSLTPDGVTLKAAVERALEQLPFLRSRDQDSTFTTGISTKGIGAAPYLCQFIIAPALTRLFGEGLVTPTVIAELPADRLVLSGIRGHIDIALHTGEADWPQTWASVQLGQVHWELFGSSKFFPAPLSREEIANVPIIYPAFWSPEGLRDGDHDFPEPLPLKHRSHGMTSAIAALNGVKEAAVATYLPSFVVRDCPYREIVRIEMDDRASITDDLYMSFRTDALTPKQRDLLVERFRQSLVQPGAQQKL